MMQGIQLIAVAFLAFSCSLAMSRAEETPAWESLAESRTHILMRHAEAPGTGDPEGFQLGDCSTQRNLSDTGRDQARHIGETIKDRGIKVDRVLSSQWCRASETASLLGLASVVEDTALNSFFDALENSGEQSNEVKRRLSDLDLKGERAILVTHQVNVTALTGVFPASGEMIVVRLSGNELQVLGRLVLDRREQ